MPYIKKNDRDVIYKQGLLDPEMITSAGELNYVFSIIMQKYIESKGERYQNYNDIMGAIEGAKLELYRRHIGPYENNAINKNGDI